MNDRLRGTLIGLAVGDALGAAVEFQPPGTFEPVIVQPRHLKETSSKSVVVVQNETVVTRTRI